MAKETSPPEPSSPAAELRAVLIKRLALAGGLVAALLSVLAFFDYLSKSSNEPDFPVFTQPVPVGPRKAVTQPVTPAENLPEPPTSDALPPPAAPAEDKPVETPAADVDPPPAPAPVATPATSSANVENGAPAASTVSSPRHAQIVRGGSHRPEAVSRPASQPINRPQIARGVPEEVTSSPPMQSAPLAPADSPRAVMPEQRVATPALAENTPPGARVIQRSSRLFSGFVLQAGVFSSVQRAEELHARLTLSGVPSSVETRVQVGPFRTREEAEAAQIKLRELGIESVLVPTRAKP